MSYFRNISHPFISILLGVYSSSVLLFSYAEGKTAITKVAGVALIFAFLYQLSLGGKKIVVVREFYLLGAWFVVALLSSIVAIDQQLALQKVFTLLQIMPLAFILFNLQAWAKDSKSVWLFTMITTILISVITYANPFLYSVAGRLTGTLGNANLYGLVLVIAIAFTAFLILSFKSYVIKLLLVPVIPALFYMLLETGSRKAIVGVILVLVLLGISQVKFSFKKNVAYGVVVLALGGLILASSLYYISQSTYYYRIESLFKAAETHDINKAEASAKGRLDLYKVGIKVALNHPILGVGPDNFRRTRTEGVMGSAIGTYSHSNYLEILTNTGLLGFTLYYLIYISMFIRLFQLRKTKWRDRDREYYTIIVAFFVMYAVYDFAMVSYAEKVSWLILSTIMASIYLLKRKYSRGEEYSDAGLLSEGVADTSNISRSNLGNNEDNERQKKARRSVRLRH